MENTAKQKVPGGKMLIIKVKFSNKIESIQILGDFFLYPEDSLQKIEGALLNLEVSDDEEKIKKRVERVLKENKIEIVGITPEAIAQTVKMAVKQ